MIEWYIFINIIYLTVQIWLVVVLTNKISRKVVGSCADQSDFKKENLINTHMNTLEKDISSKKINQHVDDRSTLDNKIKYWTKKMKHYYDVHGCIAQVVSVYTVVLLK